MRGITSACAEQTLFLSFSCCLSWDHLRVCGADATVSALHSSTLGSPPRVRSRLVHEVISFGDGGITSACAEQTHIPDGRDGLD